ncbi:MAG: HEAT repeat domain-containing protein [Pirellulales bacterium]
MKLLKHKEPGMRNLAARRLGRLGTKAEVALPELRRIAERDKSEVVRQSAAEAANRIAESIGH